MTLLDQLNYRHIGVIKANSMCSWEMRWRRAFVRCLRGWDLSARRVHFEILIGAPPIDAITIVLSFRARVVFKSS